MCGSGGHWSVAYAILVSVCVRALKGKSLELSTPNLVHVYSIAALAEPRHALTLRSKVKFTWSWSVMPSWVCKSI